MVHKKQHDNNHLHLYIFHINFLTLLASEMHATIHFPHRVVPQNNMKSEKLVWGGLKYKVKEDWGKNSTNLEYLDSEKY